MIYNANGTFLGELTFIAKKLFKQTSCGACDITHSFTEMGEKKEFKQCRARLGITLNCIHSNDMDDILSQNVKELPILVKREATSIKIVFTKSELDAFRGSVSEFEVAFQKKIAI